MANLFDGYYSSIGKMPIEKIIDENLKVETPEGDYVGLLNPKYVQFDVDDEKYAKVVFDIIEKKGIKCDILETKRGYHFYFKDTSRRVENRKIGWFSAIGVKADYGVGWKKLTVPLRLTYKEEQIRSHNGSVIKELSSCTVERKWVKTYDELDEIPAFLLPISKNDIGLTTLTSERNNTLFSYKLTLAKCRLTDEEIEDTLTVINEFILPNPLSSRELSTVARCENFDEKLFYDEKGKFKHEIFGNVLISTHNVVLVEGRPHIFCPRNNLYSAEKEDFEKVMIDKIPNLKANQRVEVFKYISLQNLRKEKFAQPKFIALQDNILDLETMELFEYSDKFIVNNKISYNYEPEAYHELLDKTIDKVMCGDKQLRMLFEEMLGYLLYRQNKFRGMFMLTGKGSNGKSTILNLIKEMLGEDNYSTLDVQSLEDKFRPSVLVNKMANIGDDIPDKYLTDSSVLKSVVTGGTITVEKKGEQPFDFTPRVKLIFACNNPPKSADKTEGLSSRIIFIPFNAKFSKDDEDFDPFIEDKLLCREAMEYLVKLAINGLKRLLINNKFTESSIAQAEKETFEKDNNNVIDYLDDTVKLHLERRTDVYKQYTEWCKDHGYSEFNYKHFTNTVLQKYPNIKAVTKNIGGKSQRIFYDEKKGGLM